MPENSPNRAERTEKALPAQTENNQTETKDQGLPHVRISVRALVEFILRSGDIDNRMGTADKDAMLLGAKLHRKIQRGMGAGYHPEVSLRFSVPCKGFILEIEGRADGVWERKEGVVIDEIKGVFKDLALLEEPVEVHLAQARCYAYIYSCQHNLEEIGVQMTYCHLETEDIKRFQSVYAREELEGWFYDLVGKYEKWARYRIQWEEKRNQSIRQVEFPFPYREGQRKLVASVYRTIQQGKELFIQAPTGVGKTMACVFPAVRAMGEGLGEKIFYLTAKTITRTVAWQAFDILKEQALRMKVLVLTAKEKICFCEKQDCNPEACPYAKGHFDRVNDAVYELLTTSDEMSREILEEQARKWQVCPYEMSLDLAEWVDAVICDYNYVFDPNAHLRRFFGEGMKGDYLFLIDEAHNLVERGREMYSASLCKEEVLKIRRLIKEEDGKLSRRLEECNRQMLALKRECEGCRVLDSVSALYLRLLNLMGELERYLEEHKGQDEKREAVLEFYFAVCRFVSTCERVDENYLLYSEIREDGKFQVCLFCVNPSRNLQNFLEKGRSAVFFSATLLPIRYYKQLLSTEEEAYAIYARSPFDPANRLLLLGKDVSTRYTRRGEGMYQRYARYLLAAASGKRGNYIAFFPSYRFMEAVYEEFQKLLEEERENPGIECVMQSQYMTEEAREIFLENFEEARDQSLMGFCVMGGIFAEGIDLARDRLIGAVIVGTGLPQVCRERELLKEYFEGKGKKGFDYAYLYPGMNKVLQSAGRVIRTDEDRGVILLLDDRFGDARYRETFPREWEKIEVCTLTGVEERLREFWAEE